MLVNEKFIFLQLQKTGGTHIESLLLEWFPDTINLGKHFRPEQSFNINNRKIVGAIRNPWEWYLSYWSYSCLNKGGPYYQCCKKKSLTKFFSNGRKLNCHKEIPYGINDLINCTKAELHRPRSKWEYLYSDSNNPKLFREWLKLILDHERRFDLFQDYGVSSVSNIAGIYTYLFLFLFTKDFEVLFDPLLKQPDLKNIQLNLDIVLRVENLEHDFIAALRSMDVPITEQMNASIVNKEKTNTSKRAHPYNFYYDDETIELVRNKEQFLIERFGYKCK